MSYEWDDIRAVQVHIRDDIYFNGDNGSANQLISKNGSNQMQWINISSLGVTGSTGPTGPTGSNGSTGPTGPGSLIYNSSGLITSPKIWTGTVTSSGGSATFNISSAGFTNIYGIECAIRSSDATANQGVFCVITSSSTTSVVATLYNYTTTSVVILSISVLASQATAVYTATNKNISITVYGS